MNIFAGTATGTLNLPTSCQLSFLVDVLAAFLWDPLGSNYQHAEPMKSFAMHELKFKLPIFVERLNDGDLLFAGGKAHEHWQPHKSH